MYGKFMSIQIVCVYAYIIIYFIMCRILIMKLAVFISGRITRYEDCLLPILKKCPYDVDLFISINSIECEYNMNMKQILEPWLKDCFIQPFSMPESWNHNHPHNYGYQLINNKYIPYNQMSMFYNDYNCIQMIEKYSKNNNIHYDCIMKLRADMFDYDWPTLSEVNEDETCIYSVFPQLNFRSHGLFHEVIVSDAWVWGNMKSMKVYCDTYNFVIYILDEQNGDYYINFEDCVTDNVYYNNLSVIYKPISYKLDANRRIFDTIRRNAYSIPNSFDPVDIRAVSSLSLVCFDPLSDYLSSKP